MKKILLIEYSQAIREDISILLTFEGFIVLEAENGAQGLKIIEEEFPDLILCDVYMPDLDGYQVLENLRNNAATTNIPFIFLTSMIHKGDLRKIRDFEVEYLVKPFNPEILVLKINNIFRVREINLIK
jgi:two-component system sensor histidine kinase/response regulator